MPGTGPVFKGNEQILAEDKESLINQKLDNGSNTLIIFLPSILSRNMFAQHIRGNRAGEGGDHAGGKPSLGTEPPHPDVLMRAGWQASCPRPGGHTVGPQEARSDRHAGHVYAPSTASSYVPVEGQAGPWGPDSEWATAGEGLDLTEHTCRSRREPVNKHKRDRQQSPGCGQEGVRDLGGCGHGCSLDRGPDGPWNANRTQRSASLLLDPQGCVWTLPESHRWEKE